MAHGWQASVKCGPKIPHFCDNGVSCDQNNLIPGRRELLTRIAKASPLEGVSYRSKHRSSGQDVAAEQVVLGFAAAD